MVSNSLWFRITITHTPDSFDKLIIEVKSCNWHRYNRYRWIEIRNRHQMYSVANCKRCNRTVFNTTQDNYQSALQQTYGYQNLENIRPWHYRQFKDRCCCYFSPIYHTTCACIRSAATAASIGCNSNRPSTSCTATLSKRGNSSTKRTNSLRRHSHHTMADSIGPGYLFPALSQAPVPHSNVAASTATALPHQPASVNSKLCTKCHKASPAFRQFSFADGHAQLPEDNNMVKYSIAGEDQFIIILYFIDYGIMSSIYGFDLDNVSLNSMLCWHMQFVENAR